MSRESKIWNLKSIIFAICITLSGTAHAQQRPLVTEDPETIGSGLGLNSEHVRSLPSEGSRATR